MPNISNRLFLVFERSKLLDEVALHHLVNALCEQSADTMDQAYGSYTKEPSLFAVAKLVQAQLKICRGKMRFLAKLELFEF